MHCCLFYLSLLSNFISFQILKWYLPLPFHSPFSCVTPYLVFLYEMKIFPINQECMFKASAFFFCPCCHLFWRIPQNNRKKTLIFSDNFLIRDGIKVLLITHKNLIIKKGKARFFRMFIIIKMETPS